MLTEVEFHTGVADPIRFACRLLRKVQRQRQRAWVTAPPQWLVDLDAALWVFEPASFIPHLRVDDALVAALKAAAPGPDATTDPAKAVEAQALRVRTPIWLAERAIAGNDRSLLINIGGSAPPDASGWQRVIEIVAAESEAAALGRERWRAWRDIGVQVVHHAARAGDG